MTTKPEQKSVEEVLDILVEDIDCLLAINPDIAQKVDGKRKAKAIAKQKLYAWHNLELQKEREKISLEKDLQYYCKGCKWGQSPNKLCQKYCVNGYKKLENELSELRGK